MHGSNWVSTYRLRNNYKKRILYIVFHFPKPPFRE